MINSKHFATDYHQLLIMAEYLTYAEIADLIYRVNHKALGGAISEVYDVLRGYYDLTQSRIKVEFDVRKNSREYWKNKKYKVIVNKTKLSSEEKEVMYDKFKQQWEASEAGEVEKRLREEIYDEIFNMRKVIIDDISSIPINNIDYSGITDGPGVYIIKSQELYKIGMSVTSVRRRIISHKGSNPFTEIIAIFETDHPGTLEAKLHNLYSNRRVMGEWFTLDISDIEEIINLFNNG